MSAHGQGSGRLPSFIIAGTQKGGTTWLEHNLNSHPDICTPGRQLHFFDRHFDQGLEWYQAQFEACKDASCLGEKTTEYLDTYRCAEMARRMAATLPDARLIFMLRNPVDRALSAVQHMVNSGLERIPQDAGQLMQKDARRPDDQAYRYLDRGLYAQQLAIFRQHFAPEQMLCLILEEDVRAAPDTTWQLVCRFLDVPQVPARGLDKAVNVLRLSRPALTLSRWLYNVPFARGIIRRVDGALPLQPWKLETSPPVREQLAAYYAQDIAKLEQMLDRPLDCWKGTRP